MRVLLLLPKGPDSKDPSTEEAPDASACEFHASAFEGSRFETFGWQCPGGNFQIRGNHLFIGTRLRHIDSELSCKQQVCHHELHLRLGLMLLHLERRTLAESSTESAAWLGSHFRGISPYASVRSKHAGEEPVFAFYLHNSSRRLVDHWWFQWRALHGWTPPTTGMLIWTAGAQRCGWGDRARFVLSP